jgi:hypothetical protein
MNQKLKSIKNVLIVLIIVAIVFALAELIGKKKDNTSNKKNKLTFEQIGYFKSQDRLRYFTFYVEVPEQPDYIHSENFYNEIKKHGAGQMYTDGKTTASFYYLDKKSTPDITLLNAQQANNIAHENNPIASVWIHPTGKINLIKNPQ